MEIINLMTNTLNQKRIYAFDELGECKSRTIIQIIPIIFYLVGKYIKYVITVVDSCLTYPENYHHIYVEGFLSGIFSRKFWYFI